MAGRTFTVTAILQETGSQDDGLLFVPLAAAQAITDKQDRITLIEVAALCSGCPITEMVDQIAGVLPDAKVSAIKQVVEGRLQTIGQLKRFSLGMGGVIALISLSLVFVTMMGSVNERKVEIGIFRAIGYRTGHVMGIILLEAGLVGLVAGLIGYGLGLGAAAVALAVYGQLRPPAPAGAVAGGPAGGAVGGAGQPAGGLVSGTAGRGRWTRPMRSGACSNCDQRWRKAP